MPHYRFSIDSFTPDTLPMQRLAEYMGELAKLLGEPNHVHFVDVEEGSAVLVADVEPVAFPKVARRITDVSRGIGPADALAAEKRLDDMLAADNAIGSLIDNEGTNVIPFPGRTRPKPLRYGPFRQEGVLEGTVIRVGGKDDTVPVWLRDRTTILKCTAPIDLARQITRYNLDAAILRVRGSGRWMREEDGTWTMEGFTIQSYEVLDDSPLFDVIRKLHAVEGADWSVDPLDMLQRLRRGEDLN